MLVYFSHQNLNFELQNFVLFQVDQLPKVSTPLAQKPKEKATTLPTKALPLDKVAELGLISTPFPKILPSSNSNLTILPLRTLGATTTSTLPQTNPIISKHLTTFGNLSITLTTVTTVLWTSSSTTTPSSTVTTYPLLDWTVQTVTQTGDHLKKVF